VRISAGVRENEDARVRPLQCVERVERGLQGLLESQSARGEAFWQCRHHACRAWSQDRQRTWRSWVGTRISAGVRENGAARGAPPASRSACGKGVAGIAGIADINGGGLLAVSSSCMQSLVTGSSTHLEKLGRYANQCRCARKCGCKGAPPAMR
jgi:hypothetical protein